jgi:uncharacterized protein (DUF1501 family)
MQRKDFILRTGALATGSLFLPRFLKAFDYGGYAQVPQGNKVIVIIQLSGGNDGLNTVIPIANDLYFSNRPKLAIQKNKALLLADNAALHPNLTALEALYKDGHMSIINNVGYPNPDRSHFRSMDIWHTGSASNEYWSNGWVGRYLDAQCNGCDKPTYALEMDDLLSLTLKGEINNGIAVKDPRKMYGNTQERFFREINANRIDEAGEQPVDYLYKTLANTMSSADYIFNESKRKATKNAYPATELGNSLKTIASLIMSDINTKVYYVSLGSFDTHIAQEANQGRLLKTLNDAVGAFTADLKANNRFEDVLTFTFSEFGRRVKQNFSGGTDHGTANHMLFFSGGLKKKGLLNDMPNLSDLQDGDLKHSVDFKEVYATILNKWLGADDVAILKKKYKQLDFI